jgi:PAS domain S-box-containing protein
MHSKVMHPEPAKFLLVDDLQDNLLALKAILSEDGIELFAAQSGPAALELMLVHEFALAIVDVQMPGMDGFELAELMRGTERTRHIPIIFVTAANDDSCRRFRGYESGAVDFLFKPIEVRILKSKAAVFVNLFRQKQEIRYQRDALRDRERELQSLSDNSPIIITRVDRDFRHIFVSAAIERFTGMPPAAHLQKTNRELGMNKEFCDMWEQAIQSVFETGQNGSLAFDYSSRWGICRFESQLVAERNPTGEVENVLGVTRDITQEWEVAQELQRAKEAAESANQAKDSFLAMMSHELRTPMTSILGYTDLVLQRVSDPELTQYLQTVHQNGDYLLKIINDILDLSKIEADKLDINRERFSLFQLIDEVLRIMEVRALEKGLQLNLKYHSHIPEYIESDSKRLKQILINLLGNAIKFTDWGKVDLMVQFVAPSDIQFEVIDTGIGISQQNIDHLFQPFTQVDTTVSRRFGGTGLGLAISLRLTHLLGGTIGAKSEPGRGSTFTVRIPAGNHSELMDIDEIEALSHPSQVTKQLDKTLDCHILVVDDRREIRFLSRHLLTSAGATVAEAEDGQIALSQINQSLGTSDCPDLILLDMQMPGLDGYATAAQLRTLGFDRPIIALTGNAMPDDRQKCMASGCNAYLSKPIDAQLLVELVSRLVHKVPTSSCESDR